MTQPGSPGPPPTPRTADTPTTNMLAVLAVVFGLVAGPLAIVFGTVALTQIRRTGQGGRGLAIAGIAVGGFVTLLGLVVGSVIGIRTFLAPPTLARAEVTAAVQRDLVARGETTATGLTCPDDLQGKVGNRLRCRYTVDEQPVDAVVTVTAVVDGDIRYYIVAEAQPMARALLERKMAQIIGARFRIVIERTECTGDLPAVAGARADCALTAQGTTNVFEVTVTSVQEGRTDVSWRVKPK